MTTRPFVFSNVRYGLIGFHGLGVHNQPHFHTGDQKLNFDLSGLRKATQELYTDDKDNYAQLVDPLTAINFAAMSYPFRTGSMKSIILWTCGECGTQVGLFLFKPGIALCNFNRCY